MNLDFLIGSSWGGALWVFVAIWIYDGGGVFCVGDIAQSNNGRTKLTQKTNRK